MCTHAYFSAFFHCISVCLSRCLSLFIFLCAHCFSSITMFFISLPPSPSYYLAIYRFLRHSLVPSPLFLSFSVPSPLHPLSLPHALNLSLSPSPILCLQHSPLCIPILNLSWSPGLCLILNRNTLSSRARDIRAISLAWRLPFLTGSPDTTM